ncbi:MAG: hypothetical protein K8I03_13210 [Ignavibacteria bacterium]|nr:hypothetical protein [Ignavibacteria bacterium]
MIIFEDLREKQIRFTDERMTHIKEDHPELFEQFDKIKETLLTPDRIILSITDNSVELFYKLFEKTPVTKKHMCVLVKNNKNDYFVITAYFTDSVKKGQLIWEKK